MIRECGLQLANISCGKRLSEQKIADILSEIVTDDRHFKNVVGRHDPIFQLCFQTRI